MLLNGSTVWEAPEAIMRISDVLIRLIGARDPNCPQEADFLAYSEDRLSNRNRARVERHFAQCDDCRQVLAFLGRESEEAPAPFTEKAVSDQTDRVLAYIQKDERERTKPAKKARASVGFYISYPKLASVGLLICAIAIGGVFLFTRAQSPAHAGMAALKLGLKDGRYTEARISRLDHSRYVGPTRGGDSNNDDLHFDRAENKVKVAAQDPAAVDAQLMLARIHLARATREDAKQALAILNQIAARGVETPETLNDIGVAQFQLEKYDDAVAYFTKALAKSPVYNEALFNRALAEELARHNEDARGDWQEFIKKSSDDSWNNEARAHLSRLAGATDN